MTATVYFSHKLRCEVYSGFQAQAAAGITKKSCMFHKKQKFTQADIVTR